MPTCSEFRARARKNLGGNIFANAWLFTLLAILINGAILSFTSISIIGAILLYGPMTYGLAKFMLLITRSEGKKTDLATLFNGFTDDFGGTLCLGLLQSVYIFLWSLLFFIPGIIKKYSYAMAQFIKVDHPEYSATECITASRKMMQGHKWKLFCLQLSFIGWAIVGSLCFGVGTLWVQAYVQAATAAFYEELNSKNTVVAQEVANEPNNQPEEQNAQIEQPADNQENN